MIKIGIADDHEAFRDLFSGVFDQIDDIEMIWRASNGLELLKLQESDPVDAIFLDLEMPVLDGIETLKRLKTNYPDVRVITISLSQDDFLILQLVKQGARGFLIKDSGPDEIENSVRSVMKAGYYFAEPAPKVVLKNIVRSSIFPLQFNPEPGLSDQERKAVALLSKNASPLEMADEMGISESEFHELRQSLKIRLSINDRNGFRMFAQKHKDLITNE